ncbi:hypothetical protein T4E_9341 [Trichinella pseudospiralis]|uniref:Uncharacterized protein n=1 Tax=Trichinella pseudospiralis TaxID=6337 RepID=A0A0V0YPI5_TRIPS|nr:hypothetical protein T4E_9341 [Trichinella pseudospiralis]
MFYLFSKTLAYFRATEVRSDKFPLQDQLVHIIMLVSISLTMANVASRRPNRLIERKFGTFLAESSDVAQNDIMLTK